MINPGLTRELTATRRAWIPVLLLALAITAPFGSRAADVFVGTPPFNPDPGQLVSIELFVDVGAGVLGSYFVDFQYDAAVVTIDSIAGGTTTEFSSPPTTDPGSFLSGTTPVAAVQGGLVSPIGFVSVATITLHAAGLPADASNLDLAVISLFDELLNVLPSTVFPSSVLIALPEAATDLMFLDFQNMVWTASPNIALYNLYRGSLPSTDVLSFDHVCFVPDLVSPAATDPDNSAPSGTGFYYVISAERNSVEGTLGSGAPGVRPNTLPCSVLPAGFTASIDRNVVDLGASVAETAPNPVALLEYRVLPNSKGDVNRDRLINVSDVESILEAVIGTRSLTRAERSRADVDGDGDVDLADAQRVRQFLEGSIDKLQAGLPVRSR